MQISICGSGRSGGARTVRDTTYTNINMCPLETRFGCSCQLRVTNSPAETTLEMRGTHDATSDAPEKYQSKYLKLQQIEATRAGVRVAPKQSAKHLRRNMMYSSPQKRIGPDLARSVECVIFGLECRGRHIRIANLVIFGLECGILSFQKKTRCRQFQLAIANLFSSRDRNYSRR
jgi:hypothetical protein